MPIWALGVIGASALAVSAAFVYVRDREYFVRAIAFWVPAAIGSVGWTRYVLGSLRTGMLVPIFAFPVMLVATRLRPGQMFRLGEEEQSSDPEVRQVARTKARRFAMRLAVLALVTVAIVGPLTHAL